jgi:hypothetical protein
MFWIAFGIYTAFAATLWVMFLVARMHSYKFRNYSFHIVPVTKLLAAVLLVLTALGYYFVFTVERATPDFGSTLRESTQGRTF